MSDDTESTLMPRERQVLEYLLAGYAFDEIATTLNITTETVRTYAKGVYRKEGVHSARELLVRQVAAAKGDSLHLTRCATRILDARSSDDLPQVLIESAADYTGAREATRWKVAHTAQGPQLLGQQERHGHWIRPCQFVNAVIAERVHLALAPVAVTPTANSYGPQGGTIGAYLPAYLGHDVLLLSRPQSGHFEPTQLLVIRLLVRIALTSAVANGRKDSEAIMAAERTGNGTLAMSSGARR